MLRDKIRRTVVTAAAFAICSMTVQAEDKWPLQFDAADHDFGQINEADGIVSHTFAFTNISSEPVTIDYVSTSCGCTTTMYPTEPIIPGQMYEFMVNFNPARTEGKVYRDIEVFIKGRNDCMRMELEATVNPAPVGIKQMYPHLIAGSLRTAFTNIAFGYVGQHHTAQKGAVIVNDSDRPVSLKAVCNTDRDILEIDCPLLIEPGKAESIVFTFNLPQKEIYGTHMDSVWIWTDGKRGDVPFVVSAILTDDFTQAAASQPKLDVNPSYYDFGQQKSGRTLRQKFDVGNNGDGNLIIRAVECSEGVVSDLKAGTVISPGTVTAMNVSYTVKGVAGVRTSASVNLITNDPVRPRREIRMAIETK